MAGTAGVVSTLRLLAEVAEVVLVVATMAPVVEPGMTKTTTWLLDSLRMMVGVPLMDTAEVVDKSTAVLVRVKILPTLTKAGENET